MTNTPEGLVERQGRLLGEVQLLEQKAENAFAPAGREPNHRAIHAGIKAAWKAYDDCTDEIAQALSTAQQDRERMRTVLEAISYGDDEGALIARQALKEKVDE